MTPPDKVAHLVKKLTNGSSSDMAVNGSTTNVTFDAGPGAGIIWYIFEIGFSIDDSGNNTLGSFGAIATGLTNGLTINQVINSTTYEFTVIKNNLDIVETFTDHYIRGVANSFLNSTNFFSGKVELREPVTLVGDDGDTIDTIVKDNLTGVNVLEMTIEGYKVVG